MNDIPSELISSGVEGTVKTLSALSEDLGTEEMVNGVDQLLVNAPTKEATPQTI